MQTESLEVRALLAGDLISYFLADDLAETANGAELTQWEDSVSNLTGIATGTPTFKSTAIGGRAAIQFDASDGENDGFRISSAINPLNGAGDFSVAVVFATSSNDLLGGEGNWFQNTGLVDSNANGLSTDWGVTMNAAGQIGAGIGDGFGQPAFHVYSSESGLNNGDLHLAVYSKSGSDMSISIDGNSFTTTNDVSVKPRAPLDITIGLLQNSTNGFNGDIYQVRLYDGGLNEAEIQALNSEITSYYDNQAPITVDDVYSVNEDGFLFEGPSGVLRNDSDPDSDPITAQLVTTTENGELSLAENGSFVYRPNKDFFGDDPFTYTASDFRPGNIGTVTITVNPTYDPAIPVGDNYLVKVGEILSVSKDDGILSNDFNPDQANLAIELSQDVADGTLTLAEDGSFEYDPGNFAGTTSFSYRVNDGTSDSFPAKVTLRVNSTPIATSDSYRVDEDAVLEVSAAAGLLANDNDNEGDDLTLSLIDTTTHGELTLNDDGSFTYIPAAEYSGRDLFTYKVNDGVEDSKFATVTIDVTEINDPPVPVADVFLLETGNITTVTAESGLLANDTDVDGPLLTAKLVTPPNRGTLELNPDGSFTYEVNDAFVGLDAFSYRASDSIVDSDPVAVQLIFEVPLGNTSPTGDSIVTFNEIMYNPPGINDDQLEWIELKNQMGMDMDISNWRLSGGIEFDFAEGTVIPGNGHLVVAANPEELQNQKGVQGALGPFVGRLSNGGESIEIRNNSNRVMDIMSYNDRGDWPVAPDGSGVTLAKIRPHSASGDASNWTSSIAVDGTPGSENTLPGSASLVINEVAPTTFDVFQMEIANNGDQGIDLSDYKLVSGFDGKSFALSGHLAAGGFLSIDQGQLGFQPPVDGQLFLAMNDDSAVIDGQVATNRLRGRSPVHNGQWQFPTSPTFGAENQVVVSDAVVINEIMYHAAGTHIASVDRYFESAEQWVELYNRSDADVDLTGWSFRSGIDFEFPAESKIGAGEYIVIAADPASLKVNHPNLEEGNVFGPFNGNLSNAGELLQLADQNNNPVDEVRYYDGGRWHGDADARGSSLELRDPHSDNSIPEAWAASDESTKVGWQTITYGGSGRNNGNDPTRYNEFLLGMLDDGVVLIDDVTVIEEPGEADERQLIQNGTFEGDALGSEPATWRIIGTQHGTVIEDPDDPSNKVLQLRATGPTEHMHNNAGTTLKDGNEFPRLSNSKDYEISYRARWVTGSNQLNSRLYFNRLPLTTRLQRPLNGGTPGAQNSRFEENIGPTYAGLIHHPAVPDANQPTTVMVSAEDPNGVDSLKLWYSVDQGAFTSVPMTTQGHGEFSGTIPGQSAEKHVQFYVEGIDAQGSSSLFPAAGPNSRALYQVQDGEAMNDQRHNLRIVMLDDDRDFLHLRTNVMSNNRIGSTVIYNESEIFYDIGVRLKGSQRGRDKVVRVGFNLQFDPQNPFRGVHRTIGVDRSGSGDEYSQEEIIVRQIFNHAGNIPQIYDDLIHVIAPNSRHTGSAMLNMARYNDIFFDSQYENGSQGTAFEYELIYYPTSTTGGVEGLKRPNPDSVVGQPLRDLGDDKELYRWHWIIKNNRQQDNYSQLIEALKIIGLRQTDPRFHPETQRLLDVDQWLRALAATILAGIGDNWANGSQHNAQFYVRPDGKLLHLPWDMDFSFTQGPTSPLLGNGELRKLISDPGNKHNYYGHVFDIVQTTVNPDYMNRWIDHFDDLVPAQRHFSSFKNWIDRRDDSAISQIERAISRVDFAITTEGPIDVGPSATATLQGTGWVDVRNIHLQGNDIPLDITWNEDDQWQVTIPVNNGTNEYTLEAYDFQNNLVHTAAITITSQTSSVIQDSLRVSEVHFNPAEPTDDELDVNNDDYEFIEVVNIGDAAVNLEGVQFVNVPVDNDTEGFEFTFANQDLAPNERIVVVKNHDAFLSRYGDLIPIAQGSGPEGQAGYGGRLSNGGEKITLVDAAGALVQQFTYDDIWHPTTDGDGFSLQFKDPTQPDLAAWNVAANWEPSGAIGGSPGLDVAVPGDSNLDGKFNSRDLTFVFVAGEYEDAVVGNSNWAEGDWNGDGDFTSGDLVVAFEAGGYQIDARIQRDNGSHDRFAAAVDWLFDHELDDDSNKSKKAFIS